MILFIIIFIVNNNSLIDQINIFIFLLNSKFNNNYKNLLILSFLL